MPPLASLEFFRKSFEFATFEHLGERIRVLNFHFCFSIVCWTFRYDTKGNNKIEHFDLVQKSIVFEPSDYGLWFHPKMFS